MTTRTEKQEDVDVHSHPDPGAAQDVPTGHKPAEGRVGAGLFDPKQLRQVAAGRAAASSTRG